MYIRDLAESFVDVLFPPLCLSCSDLLPHRDQFICPSCLQAINRVRRDESRFISVRESICSEETIGELVVPFWFDKGSPLQSIIHAMKYQQIPQVGLYLGEILGNELSRSGFSVSHLVPVPLHKAKHREREYNQAEYIARGVANVYAAEVMTDAVIRLRHTRTQTDLSAPERRKNVSGVFAVKKERLSRLRGSSVLIIDDVITTGATICSVAKELVDRAGCTITAGSIAIAVKDSPR